MSNFSEACNIYLKFSHANRKRNHRQIELWVKYEETVIYGCFKVKLQWNLPCRPRNNNSTTDPGQKSLGMMQHSQLSVISGCPHKTVLPFYLLFFLLRPPPPPHPPSPLLRVQRCSWDGGVGIHVRLKKTQTNVNLYQDFFMIVVEFSRVSLKPGRVRLVEIKHKDIFFRRHITWTGNICFIPLFLCFLI